MAVPDDEFSERLRPRGWPHHGVASLTNRLNLRLGLSNMPGRDR